jgi:hypothetical protein
MPGQIRHGAEAGIQGARARFHRTGLAGGAFQKVRPADIANEDEVTC